MSGDVAEKIFVSINDSRQGMFIQSKSTRLPVLLYVHGGLPEYFLAKKYPTGLENYFSVVWWEQRGSGISYSASVEKKPITQEQMISDIFEVTKYLLKRFGKEKIYLMAHSGGTFLAIQAAARKPILYHAYIGVAQISNQLKSEVLAYNYMIQRFTENRNMKMVRRLKAEPVSILAGVPNSYLALRDSCMHRLGVGTTRKMRSVLSGIFLPSLMSREYTWKEKFNLWRGKSQSGVAVLWDKMISTDLAKEVLRIDVPIYFFHGRYDYTVSYQLAKSFFYSLRAPVKEFYTFEKSAHSPLFEEPKKAIGIIQRDVLIGVSE